MVTFNQDYSPGAVALACAVSFIGAYATVSLCEQFRLASTTRITLKKVLCLIMAGFAFGGVGIWGVFYLVINSCRLKFPDGSLNGWRYDITDTFVALAVAPIIAAFGLYVATTDHCFNKSKKEIMDLFITRTTAAATYSISEIKHMSRYRILFIVCTHSPERLIIGGTIAGGGLALMRYLGLRSLVIPGHIHYDAGITALTIVLSMLVMISGFWVFFRVLSVFSSLDWLRFLCAVQGMAGMCGIHYVALAGVRFEYDPTVVVDLTSSISPRPFIVSILCGTVIYSFTALIYVLSDLREWLLRTSTQLRQADLALAALMKKSLESRDSHNGDNQHHQHHNHLNNSSGGGGGVQSPYSLNSSLTRYIHNAHTHFQAPLEVINYSRRYMEEADARTRTSQIGFAGLALPPPMFNDFNVECDVEMGNLESLNKTLNNTTNQAMPTPNKPTNAFSVQNPNNMDQCNPKDTNNSNHNNPNHNPNNNSNHPATPGAGGSGVFSPSPMRGLHDDLSAQFRGQLMMASKSGSNNSTQLAQQLANLRYKPLAKSGSTNNTTVLAGFESGDIEANGLRSDLGSGSGGGSGSNGGISTGGSSRGEVHKAVNEGENGDANSSDKNSIVQTEAATTVHSQ